MNTPPFNYHVPWTREGLDIIGRRNESGLPRQIARVSDEVTGDLIAAAPVMYAALKTVLSSMYDFGWYNQAPASWKFKAFEEVSAALAAARKGGAL